MISHDWWERMLDWVLIFTINLSVSGLQHEDFKVSQSAQRWWWRWHKLGWPTLLICLYLENRNVVFAPGAQTNCFVFSSISILQFGIKPSRTFEMYQWLIQFVAAGTVFFMVFVRCWCVVGGLVGYVFFCDWIVVGWVLFGVFFLSKTWNKQTAKMVKYSVK